MEWDPATGQMVETTIDIDMDVQARLLGSPGFLSSLSACATEGL